MRHRGRRCQLANVDSLWTEPCRGFCPPLLTWQLKQREPAAADSTRGLISDLQPQAGPDGSRSRAQCQALGNSFGCLLLLAPKCTRCSLLAECFCNFHIKFKVQVFFFNLCFSPQTQVQQPCMINYLKTPKYLQKRANLALSSLSFLLLPPQI